MAAVGMVLGVRRRLALLVSDKVPGDKLSASFRNGVEQLNSQLGDIERFLLKHNNSSGDFEKQVIQLAYDVEDAVESLYLQQQYPDEGQRVENQPRSSAIRFIRRGRARSSKATNSSQDGFQSLKDRMDNLCNICGNNWGEPQSVTDLFSDEQQHPVPEKIVGMDDPLSPLFNDNANEYPSAANSIWICGMGGIGKTTLAREIFNSSSVLMNFQGRAWVRVGLKFQARDIAASILFQLASSESSKEEIQAVETTELMERLYKAQVHRRCLVVLDDVRSVQDWETIRFAFASELGTRIVITSRCSLVEAGMAKGYVHNMEHLSKDNSWELFKNHLSVLDLVAIGEQPNEVRESMMARVISRSGRLPLALTVLGGMARGNVLDCLEKLHALPEIENEKLKKLNFEKLPEILALSNTYLPFQLKTCFLYLGHFLNDEVIPAEKLCLMWMAEGLVSKGGETSMDTAARYLDALVQRRLVMVQREDLAGVIKVLSCELHDWIYKICKSEGEKEGFARMVDLEKSGTLSSKRRIAIDLDDPEPNGSSNILEPKHVRSLLIKGDGFLGESSAGVELLGWPGEIADLKEFQWARVVDFDRVDFRSRNLPRGIDKLVYLRYLSFRGCYLEELPSSFTRFPFLETLDLLVRTTCKMIIPDILWKMSCLLHLYFPVSFQSSDTEHKLKLGGLTRLETLENFHAGICDADDLQLLTNLQNFKGVADSNNDDVQKMINFVEGNQHLHSSSLSVRNFDSFSAERIVIVRKLLRCNGLQALDIDGHIGELEDHFDSVDPEGSSSGDPVGSGSGDPAGSVEPAWSGLRFTEMIFNASEFNKDPMKILGRFSCLRSLVLCNDAFLGNKLEFAESSFSGLKCLKLSNLWFLEELVVEPGAMSSLSSLTIEQCGKVKSLPDGLMENTDLQEVKIRQMTEEFLQHVMKMAEEQQASGGKVVVRHFL